MYDPDKRNPSPEGSITTGIDDPSGLAVDRNGTLYVANGGNDTIAVYPRGQTSPTFTISSGLDEPRGLAIDSHREIFAIDAPNDGTSSLVGYKPGSDKPFETIDLSAYGSCEGVAVDGKDNLWLTCSGTKAVYEIRADTLTLQNAKLEGLKDPSGISFGKDDLMYVSDTRSNGTGYIRLYLYGTRSPLGTLNPKGTPAFSCVTSSGAFFVIEASSDVDFVTGYKYGSRTPFSAFDEAGIGYPFLLAVASTP
jgi:sugar lactone lactonase YvrE